MQARQTATRFARFNAFNCAKVKHFSIKFSRARCYNCKMLVNYHKKIAHANCVGDDSVAHRAYNFIALILWASVIFVQPTEAPFKQVGSQIINFSPPMVIYFPFTGSLKRTAASKCPGI